MFGERLTSPKEEPGGNAGLLSFSARTGGISPRATVPLPHPLNSVARRGFIAPAGIPVHESMGRWTDKLPPVPGTEPSLCLFVS
jgi:hypothetical protein